ncbi:porin family protein [Mucilaginibacter sp. L196]|uniref:porin family protein n=1 Tax=Mucilaginibacter sp. L196 TaxID=1641870 RepID=UPI00131ADF96|nr:porin family protein [Mucilaginibacter sp. L196]
MKKLFTTLAIVLGCYSLTFAQQKGSVEFGANVGYNNSYVNETYSNQSSDLIGGLNTGLFVDSYFSSDWSLKVEVNYDQKGWGNGFYTDPNGNTYDGVNFRLNYITIPVLASWHFGYTRNWYVHFGPYIGILTGAKETTDDIDVKQIFNTVDAGIDVGLGVKIPISNRSRIFFEYDGQGGLTNIFKDNGDYSSVQTLRSSINAGINFSIH